MGLSNLLVVSSLRQVSLCLLSASSYIAFLLEISRNHLMRQSVNTFDTFELSKYRNV